MPKFTHQTPKFSKFKHKTPKSTPPKQTNKKKSKSTPKPQKCQNLHTNPKISKSKIYIPNPKC